MDSFNIFGDPSENIWEAHSDSDDDLEDTNGFHKITLDEIKKKISVDYEISTIHKYSSALDNIASFIKSQAFIYNEASNYCKYRLNCLMFPCILLSSLCTVFSGISGKYKYGTFYIAIINALISFLLAIVNYLKLDAASEAHKISSHQYDKLQSTVEFTSGSVLLFRYNDIQKMEYQLDQIKDKKVESGIEISELKDKIETKLYHLLTDNDTFNVNQIKFYDYNASIDLFLDKNLGKLLSMKYV